jgi:hypothetical protein
MQRCTTCGGTKLTETDVELEREVAGRSFRAVGPGMRCTSCNEAFVPGGAVAAMELAIAAELARSGVINGEAFRFMRKAVGLPATELAALLDVAPEPVSRWENEKLPVERRALALLASMVLDRVDGVSTTLDRLRALRNPPETPAVVRISFRTA